MQDASAEFEQAVRAHRTWAPPRLRTDWDGTGYGGDGSIDDLSVQSSSSWSVTHELDDGYPDSVTFVSGTGVPEFDTELAGRVVSGTPYTAVAYWSPLRADSPIAGYDRDVAPVTHDVGLVTSAGREYVRLFTGQMVNTPVKGGRASLQTLSSTRAKLMRPVQPPATSAYHQGMNASWPISWALRECGLYTSPPARPGCRWHVPMHGSSREFVPSGNSVDLVSTTPWRHYWWYADAAQGEFHPEGPSWVDGPFLLAPDLQLTADLSKRQYASPIEFADGDDLFSVANNKARLEMWVRGDATDVSNAPGGSGTVSRLCGLRMTAALPSADYVFMGIDTSRRVFVTVYDGFNTRTLTSSDTLPTDGEWYMVGAAYDMTTNRLWVRNFAGVTESSTQTMNELSLWPTDNWDSQSPDFVSYIPVAEIHLTGGLEANVDLYPDWLADIDWTQNVRMTPSSIDLKALVEPVPREAWEYIGSFAKAELASMRPDELDVFEYLGPGWWVRDEQQVVTDQIRTDLNAAGLGVDLDPSKVRNSITVKYTDVQSDPLFNGQVLSLTRSPIPIPPGSTSLTFGLSSALAIAVNPSIEVLTGAEVVALGDHAVYVGYVTLNDVDDGSGNDADEDLISVTLESWNAGSVTLRFDSSYIATTFYLANGDNKPSLNVTGAVASTSTLSYTDEDAASIAVRGRRFLDVSAPILQSRNDAGRLARRVKMALRRPAATIGDDTSGIDVTGNPLRQPGDLVGLDDPDSGADGELWRLQSVKHQGDGPKYVNQLVVRRVQPLGVWGQSTWGNCLWQQKGGGA